jgi:hypothetical protein
VVRKSDASDDAVEGTALGLGEQISELLGAHPYPSAEVIDEHNALLKRGGFVDEKLRASAAALAAKSGERLQRVVRGHGEPPVSLPDHSTVLA